MADKNLASAWIFLVICASLADLCQAAVHIKALRVPAVVQNGGVDSVFLDCDYELSNPYGLVVKWYFAPDDKMTMRPIYQWIAEQKPHALGAFKNFVDLSYKASDDPNFRYRAMNLLKPTRNMSGTYQCVVETYYDGTAEESAKMLVYVPQSMILLGQEKVDEETLKVSCLARDVYPTPIMTMHISNSILSDLETDITQSSDVLFNVRVTSEVRIEELPEDPAEMSCELSIPEANYTAKQEGLVYKGGLPEVSPADLTAASADLTAAASRNLTFANSARIFFPCLQILIVVYLSQCNVMNDDQGLFQFITKRKAYLGPSCRIVW